MKKLFLLSIMLGAVTLSAVAQDDDMYFVPTKKNVAREKATYGIPSDTYYSGSPRSVDDYNRRWASQYEVLPADTGDIISFAAVEGVYPDSLSDFALTQQMQRFDGYEPGAAYMAGYRQGRSDSWHSPWYYSYYPWYDSWYWDPWYWDYGWYGGWYSPWYYGYYGYYRPWYYTGFYGWGGGAYVAHNHYPGTQNHGRMAGGQPSGFGNGRTHSFSSGTFGGSRTVGSFGGNRSTATRGTSTSTRTRTPVGTYSNSNGNFGGARSTTSGSTYTPTRSSGSTYSGSSSSSGGGSFGGSRSSGGGGGGGSRGGGGFGGGRR